jgi:hypothetical protein
MRIRTTFVVSARAAAGAAATSRSRWCPTSSPPYIRRHARVPAAASACATATLGAATARQVPGIVWHIMDVPIWPTCKSSTAEHANCSAVRMLPTRMQPQAAPLSSGAPPPPPAGWGGPACADPQKRPCTRGYRTPRNSSKPNSHIGGDKRDRDWGAPGSTFSRQALASAAGPACRWTLGANRLGIGQQHVLRHCQIACAGRLGC